jgi:murein DD-endopeptidase MepM/ murein hydrolase activator NlpD
LLDRPDPSLTRRPGGDLVRLQQARAVAKPGPFPGKPGSNLPAIYLSELGPRRVVTRVKWLVSTLIVGVAGLAVIGIVIFASLNMDQGEGVLDTVRRASVEAMQPVQSSPSPAVERPAGIGRKTGRIEVSSKGVATKHLIFDQVVERRGTRDYISNKPYARLVANLATDRPVGADIVPAFDPLQLFGNDQPIVPKDGQGTEPTSDPRVTVRFVDVQGGFLPEEDGQELSRDDVERLVAETDALYAESAANFAEVAGVEQPVSASAELNPLILPAQNMTVLFKRGDDEDFEDSYDTRSITARGGEAVEAILKRQGVSIVQAGLLSDLVANVSKRPRLQAGQEVRLALAASTTEEGSQDVMKISLFSGKQHELTLARNNSGEFEVSGSPVRFASSLDDSETTQRATVYLSTYRAALSQNLPDDFITKFLRIHSYDVDYKLKVRPGDGFELFYEIVEDESGNEVPGELLFAAVTIGGETRGYYRFRTPDGTVDYYDDKGSNSKKFLMRTPVKAGRLTSGFGYRKHPLLGIRKMHAGVDWAAPVGTPIMAAGNGTIEVAGREGGYGNYIRIRHANGYRTAYAHMVRFAEGVARGVRVRQGQVIGYVGSTGLSSGPHLHYEVHVNNRFMNPLSIKVPRSRQLQGRLLTEFKREKTRIDELMRRAPVKTRVAAVEG